MKKCCSKCLQEKDFSEFRKDKSRPDGVTPWCKVCAREFYRSQYSTKYGDKYAIASKDRRSKQVALLEEYKNNLQCIVCGEEENVCLEFHHIDPSQKEFQVGNAIGRSWEKILDEIRKCVCLCSNCHKKVHAEKIKLPS